MVRRVDWVNAVAAVGVLAAGVGLAVSTVPAGQGLTVPETGVARSWVAETKASATGRLKDASGKQLPLKHYERIGGGSLVADRLLLMLCEPDRIAAFSSSAARAYQPYRFAGKPALPQLTDVEAILAHNLDLLIVNNMSQQPHLQRLRDAGVAVFDLGSMHGLATLLPNIDAVGLLLGQPERAAALKRDLMLRAQQIAAHVAPEQRRTAIYVGVHGDKMYGGTTGSSFHDILSLAGLRDAAAPAFVGWPRYTSEQVLMLDPEVILTQIGMRHNLCDHPGLSHLKACAPNGRIVELDPALLLDPGLAMVEAAAQTHAAAYGDAAPAALGSSR